MGSEQLQVQLSVLDEPNLPNPLQVITDSDIEEANDANMVDPDGDEDIDNKSALGQMRLVSYSQTLFSIFNMFNTPRANYASHLFCWRCYG